jgi:hypothetical protein
MVFNTTVNNISVTKYIVSVRFIGGGNRSIEYTSPSAGENMDVNEHERLSNFTM